MFLTGDGRGERGGDGAAVPMPSRPSVSPSAADAIVEEEREIVAFACSRVGLSRPTTMIVNLEGEERNGKLYTISPSIPHMFDVV